MKLVIALCVAVCLAAPALAGGYSFPQKTEDFCENSDFYGWSEVNDYTAKQWILEYTDESSLRAAANEWANNELSYYYDYCYAKDVELKKACAYNGGSRKLLESVGNDCFAFQVRMELKCCNGDYCKSGRAFWEETICDDSDK